MFTAETASEIKNILLQYPDSRSALLPVLHIAQREFGWLSPSALESVATLLHLPKAHVRGVATFHIMLKHKPCGRHVIQLCTNVSCMLFGTKTLLEILKNKYDLLPDGMSPDSRFSLVIMECIGACDSPPAMLVGSDLHTNLTAKSIVSILEGYT